MGSIKLEARRKLDKDLEAGLEIIEQGEQKAREARELVDPSGSGLEPIIDDLELIDDDELDLIEDVLRQAYDVTGKHISETPVLVPDIISESPQDDSAADLFSTNDPVFQETENCWNGSPDADPASDLSPESLAALLSDIF